MGIDGFRECWDLIPKVGHKTEHLTTLRNHFTEGYPPGNETGRITLSGLENLRYLRLQDTVTPNEG